MADDIVVLLEQHAQTAVRVCVGQPESQIALPAQALHLGRFVAGQAGHQAQAGGGALERVRRAEVLAHGLEVGIKLPAFVLECQCLRNDRRRLAFAARAVRQVHQAVQMKGVVAEGQSIGEAVSRSAGRGSRLTAIRGRGGGEAVEERNAGAVSELDIQREQERGGGGACRRGKAMCQGDGVIRMGTGRR